MRPESLIAGVRLRDLGKCARRVHRVLHGVPALRDGVPDFVHMLCDRGTVCEAGTLAALSGVALDLPTEPFAQRGSAALDGMDFPDSGWFVSARPELGGRLRHPDLLRCDGASGTEWFRDYVANCDPPVCQRDLDHSKGDCHAPAALPDALIALFGGVPAWLSGLAAEMGAGS